MAPRRSAPEEEEELEQEQEQGLVALEFNEPLTWRPGKPISIDTLLKRLDALSKELSELDQENVDTDSLVKVAKDVASHQLIQHKDKGVRAYTACCIVDILRLCAPDAPFTPSQLKDIFTLSVNSIIPALFDPSNPYNNQHKYVLRSFAEIKSIVLLLDVEGSEALLLKLFTTIFDGVSGLKSSKGEQVGKDVEFSMQEMLGALIDDSVTLPGKVVDVIMAQFLRAAAPGLGKERHDHVPIDDSQATLLLKEEPEAYQMVRNLCQTFDDKMARFASQYFSDVIVDATGFAGKPNGNRDEDDENDEDDGPTGPSESDLKELRKAHVLIREIWKAAPMILQNVVPQVDAELSADNVHLRQMATETLGDMISGIGAAGPPPLPVLDPAAYPPLSLEEEERAEPPVTNILTTPLCSISFSQTHSTTFHNFLSRKNDKAASIRAAWTTAVGHILSTSAGGIGLSREDEATLIRGLGEKLSDSDEKVRLAAVKAVETFKFRDIIAKLGPNGGVGKDGSVLNTLADRCRDRKPAVRVAAMSLLAKLWAVGTGEMLAGNEAVTAALSGIPSRIYNAFYANDLELNVLMDRVIYEFLVPLGYPPSKKATKNSNANGSSQSQSANAASIDHDAIRAERILLLVRSLDEPAKKAFFAMQSRRPQFAKILETYLEQCERYNGGVMESNADKITSNLNKTADYIAQFLPEHVKSKTDLIKFAKIHDRRNYNLIKYVIGQENDFKTVYKALKELIKRCMSSKDPSVIDTLLPLLYRSGCLLFNRSHLSTIMEYSKSDKDGLGAIAHEILNEISQRNPDLFKTHIGQLCKDLVDQAPTATKPNDPIVAETLKACSTYARKFPRDVAMDRKFVQTLINYALYGQPVKASKHAVNIALCKKDDKSMVTATDLLQRILKDWSYGSSNFLNKLTAVSQLELLAPKVTEEANDEILGMTFKEILLQVRTDAKDSDPDWVSDADMDEEIQAKCLSLKTLVNRVRSIEDIEDAKEKASSVWKVLRKIIKEKGEIVDEKETPKHHKARLRLLAAQLMLKLCTQKHFDDMLTPSDFNLLALTAQDMVEEVRHGFVRKLQKYLADSKLRSRYYTIIFLTAFEPNVEFKNRVETWIRSRARHFQNLKQPVLEAIMARLISLLAHHPDYSNEVDYLIDHARYILNYIVLVGTESNLGLIYKYAERVKQTQDGLNPNSDAHRVLSDLAQSVIRKWQEKKIWAFAAFPGKVGLPLGLYTALQSHSEAQAVAEKSYLPEGLDEKLDDLLRAMDRKKKRKSMSAATGSNNRDGHKSKKVKSSSSGDRDGEREAKSSRKIATAKSKKTPARKRSERDDWSPGPAVPESERRQSSRRANKTKGPYTERDSEDDDEEMLEGVAEWEYLDEDDENDHEGGDGEEEASGEEAPPKRTATAKASVAASARRSKRKEKESEEEQDEDDQPEEEPEQEEEEAATTKNGSATAKGKKAATSIPVRNAAATRKSGRGGKTAAAAPANDKDDSDLSELSDVEMADDEPEPEEEAEEPAAEEVEEDQEEAPTRAANGRKAKAPASKTKAAPKGKAKAKPAAAAAAPARPTRSSRSTKGKQQEQEEDEEEEDVMDEE
ncbi:putative SPO76 protein [Sordaria brevicollis]|uniref:SPO76 protein n=1 Tax=Sordaria brevicollis TaxID=83679 RepID=A0AAE0UCH8_SORBR|nr:putative SPO76 protein [Sordaria brevicollis]